MTALSSDRPSTDPNEDIFGHAPFAKNLANSICRHPGSDGFVLALYGPWGSGKSTVLGYVQHFLTEHAEADQPVVVTFNPWWFSGQEHLAHAFLGQLQAVLPTRGEKFKKLGDLLGDFSENVGGLIDLTGMSYGAGGIGGRILGKFLKRKPKDVPALKAEITKILREAGKQILIIIDDIDRLAPEETRQLFTVIKALADFPNVIYLLAFDREVAVQAIEQQSGLPGARYLEKIIQVPFELPPVDRVALHAALFKRLEEVLSDTPDGLFDQSRWANVFHDGIDALIQVPRDIVRFTNTLSVTYPSVVGEVNPVDFIAIEALRVFLPNLYDVVRANPEKFAGHRASSRYDGDSDKIRQAFHDKWQQEVPEALRTPAAALLQRLFPKLEQSLYGSDWLPGWRRELRVCSPDVFPTYFRLTLPLGTVRRSEILELIALAETPSALGKVLVDATKVKRPDGLSKARALLERLMDYVEADIPAAQIQSFINVLLDVGDDLVLASDKKGVVDFGNESRVSRVVYHLLKRVDGPSRLSLLKEAISRGHAIGVQRYLVVALIDDVAKHGEGGGDTLFTGKDVEELKPTWLERVGDRANDDLLAHSQLPRILLAWREWVDPNVVRDWCIRVTTSDEGMLAFLPKFCSHSTSQVVGDWAVRIQPRLNPAWIEPYVDTRIFAERLAFLVQQKQVPADAQEATDQFLIEWQMIQDGKNPDGLHAFDD